MKKWIAGALAGTLLAGALTGCAGAANDEKVIKIGATPTPHAEILSVVKDVLAQDGYQLEITEFTDYIQPNIAVNDGQLDANYFQHIVYLEDFNAERGTKLASAGAVHYEPFAIYPGKTASLDALPDGASVTVPNDATNETRALMLLEAQGLIRLKEGVDPTVTATVLDIAENPKNLLITEVDAAQLTRSLEDVDISVINGNYALQAGLSANEDALAVEDGEYAGVYVNVVAVRQGEEESEKIQALMRALESEQVRAYIEETYKGAVVPVFETRS